MFATGTAPIQIACGSEGLWRPCAGAGVGPGRGRLRDQPRTGREPRRPIEKLESHFASDDAEHWLSLLSDAGVPSGKVRSMDDVYSWDQTLSQGLKLSVDHSTLGALDLPGLAAALRRQPVLRRPLVHVAPPTLGQHNESIREWLDS